MKRHILALILLSGCSPAERPEDSRLQAGSEAVIYSKDDDLPIDTPPGTGDVRDGWAVVDAGTKVVVISDESDKPGKRDGGRPVRVNVQVGKYRGPATVGRRHLRPTAH